MLSAVYPAAVTYMACILVPVAAKCILLQGNEYLLLGALALSYALFLLNCIDNYARLFAEKQRAVEELSRSLAAAENAQREIEHTAMHDALTGLPNRRAFLTRTLALKESGEAKCALFYFDLDRFKPVNDTFGHGVGDKLLQAVGCAARRLRAAGRLRRAAWRRRIHIARREYPQPGRRRSSRGCDPRQSFPPVQHRWPPDHGRGQHRRRHHE